EGRYDRKEELSLLERDRVSVDAQRARARVDLEHARGNALDVAQASDERERREAIEYELGRAFLGGEEPRLFELASRCRDCALVAGSCALDLDDAPQRRERRERALSFVDLLERALRFVDLRRGRVDLARDRAQRREVRAREGLEG